MKLSYNDFTQKWHDRFLPNSTFKIEEADFQEFALDIADTFGVSVPNVPVYDPAATYTLGYLVRFTPASGPEAFYYSLQAGQLPAPIAVADVNWQVVPGPVLATTLSQEITLAQALGINGSRVVFGRDYAITFPKNAAGYDQVVSVAGIAGNWLASEGWLVVNKVRTKIKNLDLVAGTWEVDTRYTNPQIDALLATKQPGLEEYVRLSYYALGVVNYAVNLGAVYLNQPLEIALQQDTKLTLPTLDATTTPATLWLKNVSSPGRNGEAWKLTLFGPSATDTYGAAANLITLAPGQYARLEGVKLQLTYPYSGFAYVWMVSVEPSSGGGATYTAGSGIAITNNVLSATGAGLLGQHTTFQGERLTGPLQFRNTRPAGLSLSVTSNVASIAMQVNYRDVTRDGIWIAGNAYTSASAAPADLAALLVDVEAAIAAVPAPALAIAAEVLIRTQPIDNTLEADFFLDGLRSGVVFGRPGFFRTNYTGPPLGNVVQNAQFLDGPGNTWNTPGGGINMGNGRLAFTSNAYIYQPSTIQADDYTMTFSILNIDAGGFVAIDARGPGGNMIKQYYSAAGTYTLDFTQPATGAMQFTIEASTGSVLEYFYCVPKP